MSTHNLWFEQEYEKYLDFLSENFPFLVKFSIYLNRRVFVNALHHRCLVVPIAVLCDFLVFGFRSLLCPLLCFITVFAIVCVSL